MQILLKRKIVLIKFELAISQGVKKFPLDCLSSLSSEKPSFFLVGKACVEILTIFYIWDHGSLLVCSMES